MYFINYERAIKELKQDLPSEYPKTAFKTENNFHNLLRTTTTRTGRSRINRIASVLYLNSITAIP